MVSLVGHWPGADAGVMVVFAATLVIVTLMGAYVVRGALASGQQGEPGVPVPAERPELAREVPAAAPASPGGAARPAAPVRSRGGAIRARSRAGLPVRTLGRPLPASARSPGCLPLHLRWTGGSRRRGALPASRTDAGPSRPATRAPGR